MFLKHLLLLSSITITGETRGKVQKTVFLPRSSTASHATSGISIRVIFIRVIKCHSFLSGAQWEGATSFWSSPSYLISHSSAQNHPSLLPDLCSNITVSGKPSLTTPNETVTPSSPTPCALVLLYFTTSWCVVYLLVVSLSLSPPLECILHEVLSPTISSVPTIID